MSVVIPLYNLRHFVEEAIESALAQTLPPGAVEIVVVDDGSTDGSAEVAQRYASRICYVRQENRGLPAARNAGVRASHAPFLTFLDADDRILPEKLAAQLEVFATRPDVGVVYTGWRYIDERGVPFPERGWPTLEGDVLSHLLLGNLVHPHLPLVRRRDIERVGGFDERLGPAADWDMWIRLAGLGLRWACVDRPLAEYRIRRDAMHQDVDGMTDDCVRVLEKAFADPALPAEIHRLQPLAYQRTYLAAACDHYRRGDHVAGRRCFRQAARIDQAFLGDPRNLYLLCRWLLPLELRSERAATAEWWRLTTSVRSALTDLFGAPDLEPEIARMRWRAEIAYWRTCARLARKRLTTWA